MAKQKTIYEKFNTLLNKKGLTSNSRQGITWLRGKVESLYGDKRGVKPFTPQGMIKESSKVLQPGSRKFAGKMYMFRYVPEGKATLPYYDEFPLTFILNMYRDGFLGINFHYLPRKHRTNLLIGLDRYRSNDKYDETTRLRISYDLIRNTSRLNSAIPIIKRYKNKGIKSNIIQVLPEEWAIASLLPTESFVGASPQQVWTDTRNKM
jgi:hypothetical protein